MPFGEGEFDVAICSQGVQFFPEPAAGVSEMARVASRMAVTVWSARSEVPWFDAHILDADDRHDALALIGERLAEYKHEGGDMTIPFRAFLVTARSLVQRHLS